MIEIPKPQWGTFALVTYIPDPLGSFLHDLRYSLPGEDTPRPHVTILPPRPLKLPVDEASQQVQKILSNFSSFEVELSHVRSFPETKVLYLDVDKGASVLHGLHALLNAGDLGYEEPFVFRPHLTLTGPMLDADQNQFRRKAETAWKAVPFARGFTVDEVIALWIPPHGIPGQWERVRSYSLANTRQTAARAAVASGYESNIVS